ncbi:unnamed protein product [Didymodactylos carnosus]|uniref:AMP-dependent synthetase/ligase domain-containing protein n=1 Tax=Didymodactylos carnosus TaxID=1234261 RepID=A0A814W9M9_9BILA|nr:unnamed protein product [Didymodactylos carnosus]CAF1198457.1 unnamed protein product [Didymodactylos carnosus]CAF3769070.1 unnamed protein product [Didymodactylos carnosus]CAF3963075.1 unnamed protein product [Didymodactylos carnosus]
MEQFNFQNLHCIFYDDNEILARRLTSQFDLSFNIKYEPKQHSFSCSFEYKTNCFRHETIEKLSRQYQLLTRQLFDNKPMYELSILLPEDIRIITDLSIADVQHQHQQQCIHYLFVDRCQEHPQKLCIVLDEQSLTYSEVLYYVQLLSVYLIKECYVQPQQIVCQCVDRSIEMCIGILSILTCAAVYCPLNQQYPQKRLLSVIHDMQTQHVLVHQLTKYKFDEINIQEIIYNLKHRCLLDNELELLSNVKLTADHIAYVLSTSGTTGQPKFVPICHRNFTSFIQSFSSNLQIFTSQDNVIQIAQCSFDVHFEEIVGALVVGSTLVMLHPSGHLDMSYLSSVIQMKQVAFIDTVPTMMMSLCDYMQETIQCERLKSLRCISVCGKYLNLFVV